MLEQILRQAIEATLQPSHFELANESHGHNVAKGSETHFRAVIVSDAFSGQSRVKRHQQVYQAATEALSQGVHALAMQCFTPEEWAQSPLRLTSPPCHGGMKKDPR
ncbi:MAG: BolA family protein [Litorivicinaceae bacterium]